MYSGYGGKIFTTFIIFFIYFSNVIPFPCFTLRKTLSPPPPPAYQPTYSHFPVLAFLYTGASSLHRTKCLSPHWCLTRPSSATYAAGSMGHSMCTLWLVVWSLGAQGVWLVNNVVLSMDFQTPSAPSVLSLTPPLGTRRSVQWLTESIHLCIC